MTASERLVGPIDFGQYPKEIDCLNCGGVAAYDGGNWGTWTCRTCGTSFPWEEAHRQMEQEGGQ